MKAPRFAEKHAQDSARGTGTGGQLETRFVTSSTGPGTRGEAAHKGALLKRFPRIPGKPAHYERFVITVELGLGTRSESPGR